MVYYVRYLIFLCNHSNGWRVNINFLKDVRKIYCLFGFLDFQQHFWSRHVFLKIAVLTIRTDAAGVSRKPAVSAALVAVTEVGVAAVQREVPGSVTRGRRTRRWPLPTLTREDIRDHEPGAGEMGVMVWHREGSWGHVVDCHGSTRGCRYALQLTNPSDTRTHFTSITIWQSQSKSLSGGVCRKHWKLDLKKFWKVSQNTREESLNWTGVGGRVRREEPCNVLTVRRTESDCTLSPDRRPSPSRPRPLHSD